MSVTIVDIAKIVGVSHSTVSGVINKNPRISKVTKDKVLKVIKDLNYYPNNHARNLTSGITKLIAVVTDYFSSSFTHGVIKGLEKAKKADAEEYTFTLYSAPNSFNTVINEIIEGHKADSIILLGIKPDSSVVEKAIHNNTPVVLVGTKHDKLPSVYTDYFRSSVNATTYLIKHKCPRVGIVVLKNDKSYRMSMYIKGYIKALTLYGIKLDRKLIFTAEDRTLEAGRKVAKFIYTRDIKIDAILCVVDGDLSLGFIDELKKMGKSVPYDCSVITVDDRDTIKYISPKLSSLREDLEGLGLASYSIASKIANKYVISKKHIQYNSELVLRESTIN